MEIILLSDSKSYPIWKGYHTFANIEEAYEYEFLIKICHQGGTIRAENKTRKLTFENIRAQYCKLNFQTSSILVSI